MIFEKYSIATSSWERYYYCQNANFNVTALTDSSGNVVERVQYDPYGKATVTVEQGQTATGNPYLFQGRRWDAAAGLYNYRNRFYNPDLGRFVQRDPAGYVDGMNLYEFVGGRPVVAVDPSGSKAGDTCSDIRVKRIPVKSALQYEFGHFWIELGPEGGAISEWESYGWYPNRNATNIEAISGTSGVLNDGWKYDPHHGETKADDETLTEYNPKIMKNGYLNGDLNKPCKCVSCQEAADCIRKVANNFSGEYKIGGMDCHGFQRMLLKQCCLEWDPGIYEQRKSLSPIDEKMMDYMNMNTKQEFDYWKTHNSSQYDSLKEHLTYKPSIYDLIDLVLHLLR